MERKCTYPPLVEKSSGRSPCPDVFKVRFFDKGECFRCTKVIGILPTTRPLSKADSDAWGVRKRLGYS